MVSYTLNIVEGGGNDRQYFIIGKTKCNEVQNQMRLFEGRNAPKRKATKISHTHIKNTVRMAFDCRSNGVLYPGNRPRIHLTRLNTPPE